MNLIVFIFLQLGLIWAASIDIPMTTGSSSIGYATEDLYRRRGELVAPPDLFDLEELNRVFFNESKRHTEELKRIKFYMVSGEINLASVYLSKLAFANTKLRPVIYRYLAILSFIAGDFKKSYGLLEGHELSSTPHYAKVCNLRVLNQIILDITYDLEDQWNRCKIENFGNFFRSNMWWLETLIEIKLRPRFGITKAPFKGVKLESFSIDELKIFLKLSLYLNQEKLLIGEIAELTPEQLQDLEVRELVGQIFFRTGALANAYKYIEDLKSPNAENIKGNLYLLRNKYELAYAQFKLALEQKQNSQNAMERLLPLAWLLGDWEGGAHYAERVSTSPETFINKMTLAAAFHVQKGTFDNARQILDVVTQKSRRGGEIDVTQLYSFTSLMQNRPTETRKYANLSCAQYDLTNCWLLFQLGQWDAFPLMIRREDKIVHKREWEKLAKEDINTPLKEIVYVNQLDIEELDDKLIQLTTKETK